MEHRRSELSPNFVAPKKKKVKKKTLKLHFLAKNFKMLSKSNQTQKKHNKISFVYKIISRITFGVPSADAFLFFDRSSDFITSSLLRDFVESCEPLFSIGLLS